LQGLLESVGIPFTSSGVEGSVLTMNKQLTKQLVKEAGIATVPGICVDTFTLRERYAQIAKEAVALLGLPLIIKPAHLGSSIGISVAHNEGDLKRMLLEASYLDSELVIETFIPKYVEYNCSVRMQNGVLETSEIERPMGKDEILSFEDKYKKGAKKTGGSGMASLTRELPAKISDQLKTTIQNFAKKAYVACRCKGLVRIDFMAAEDGNLYLTEINPIPGSLAFYLWEATGIQFKQQITRCH
jgi:D-alanine-D-alanine ligase